MGINYGQLIAMLAGTAGLAAIGGKVRAHKLNEYEDTMNSSLPDGYKLPTKKHNFYFGDLAAQQKADDELFKNQQDKYRGDALLGDAAQSPESYYGASPQPASTITNPGNPAQSLPSFDYGQAVPQGVDPSGQVSDAPVISTGAVQQSLGHKLPRGLGLEGSKALLGLTQKGSEIGISQQNANSTAAHVPIAQQTADAATQNANTSALRQKVEQRKSEIEMKKTTAEIANIQQIMKLRPAESRARIAKLAQRTGHSPNSIEMMMASGKSPKQIGDILYRKTAFEAGVMPDEPALDPTMAPGGLTPGAASYLGK